MKSFLKKILYLIGLLGFNPITFVRFFKGLPFFFQDYFKLQKQIKNADKKFSITTIHPILNDRFSDSGTMSGHYFHQDLLVAQKIYTNNPKKHIDIGSRIDGFVAHVASYRIIELFDIRPQHSIVTNIIYRQADLTQLDDMFINYCDSISSLHAIEHFGLGRYGDSIDINGHIKAINNIHTILKPNGKFYFSVPIGPQRIEFNAHRVFSLKYLMDIFENKFQIDNFNYVNDKGDLFVNILLTEKDISTNFNCNYGCGIFELTKTTQ